MNSGERGIEELRMSEAKCTARIRSPAEELSWEDKKIRD